MAAELLTNLAGALSQTFATGFARQYARTTETLKLIPVSRGNGKNLSWDVEFSGATAAAHADGAAVGAGELSYDPMVGATIPWGLYRSAFSVSDTEIDAASSTIGVEDAVMDIFGERMEGAFTKLAQLINQDVILGTGTDGSGNPNIIGLLGGSTDASGTYAGISRGTYTEWKGNVLANGGVARAITTDLMDQMEANIYTSSRLKPNAIVCTPATRRKYKGLFEQSRRVVTDGRAPLTYSGGTSEFDYGTAPVVRDADCAAGKMLWLNTGYLDLVQLPHRSMANYIRQMDMALKSSDGGTSTPLPLVAVVTPLPKVGDAVLMQVSIKLQLRVRRANAFGQLNDIDES